MDSIGELGLNTGQFNQAADDAIEKLKSLGMEAVVLTGNLAGVALVVGGVLAKGIYDTRKQAEELQQAFQDIKNTDAFSDDLTTVATLEAKIKSLNGEIQKLDKEGMGERIFRFIGSAHLLGGSGFDASEDSRNKQREMMAKSIEDAIIRIGKKEAANTDVLELQLLNRKEESDLLKSQLDFEEKIAKAKDKGQSLAAAELAKQRDITAELIKQKYATDRVTEQRKQQKDIEDQAAKDTAKIIDEIMKQNDAKAKDAIAAEKTLTNETLDAYEKIQKERNAANTADRERLALNKKVTEELQSQTREMAAARGGNQTQVKREAMENEFQRKIDEANRAGNPEAVKELESQRNMARADVDVEESKKTPRQRADERKRDREQKSDEAKARARNAELERRAKNGARSAQIDDRSEVVGDQAKRAGEVENVRRQGPTPASKGFDETAAKNLQDIANAFRNKGA